MKTYQLTVSTPDGYAYDGDVCSLFLRGAEGDLAVMAGHIPFVTTVKAGECRILLEDESEKTGFADGGILTVSSEKVTFLSASFHW